MRQGVYIERKILISLLEQLIVYAFGEIVMRQGILLGPF